MKTKLYFANNGYFDQRAMMTMGVNVKEGENSIGYFGTGFKYAVAIILRLSGKISIKSRNAEGNFELTVFTKQVEEIRGQNFEVVYMNGQPAGFTTHLGINWKPWQAFRELYSNCLDEQGVISDENDVVAGHDTIITVDCAEIFNAWFNQDTYFIKGEPVFDNGSVQIFRQQRPYIYYQGIAVADMQGDAMFAYNVLSSVTLTEDRTAANRYELTNPIETAVQTMTDRELLEPILAAKDNFESKLSYADWLTPSQEFVEVATYLKKTNRGINDSARGVLAKYQRRKGDYEGMPLSPVYQQMLEKALVYLHGIDIPADEYEIFPAKGMGDGVMGRALKGKIYISETAFQMGTKQVASTLMEEWVHLKFNHDDHSVGMQNWLFDKILTMAEQINGEPI